MTEEIQNTMRLLRDGLAQVLREHQHDRLHSALQEFSKNHQLPLQFEYWPLLNMLEFYAQHGEEAHKEMSQDYVRALVHDLSYAVRNRETLTSSPDDAYRFVDSAERLLHRLGIPYGNQLRPYKQKIVQLLHAAAGQPVVVISVEDAIRRLREPSPEELTQRQRFTMMRLADLCYTILKDSNTPMSSRELHRRLTHAGFHYNQRSISLTLKKDPRFVYTAVGRTYLWSLKNVKEESPTFTG